MKRMMTFKKFDGKQLSIFPEDILYIDEQETKTWIKLRNGENYCMRDSIGIIIENVNYYLSQAGMPE